MSKKTWRCFHCDEVFKTAAETREHFGSDNYETSAVPGCISPLRDDEKARLKAVQDAETEAMKALALRRYFGDDCISIWAAFDRYDNLRFERDELRKKVNGEASA